MTPPFELRIDPLPEAANPSLRVSIVAALPQLGEHILHRP